MSESPLFIPVTSEISLEGRRSTGRLPYGAVICHPHPLYGGSMHNNVVLSLQGAFEAAGWDTVRFNFRGVGRSGGAYGDGDGEVEDVRAVARYLLHGERQMVRWCLAAYSFGTWVALKAVQKGLLPDSMILVSPPIDFLSFEGLALPAIPILITLGERDAFCREHSLTSWLSRQKPHADGFQRLSLAGTDHFYQGREVSLRQAVLEFLQSTE
jgi:alpha/beta superfamily hydrolase